MRFFLRDLDGCVQRWFQGCVWQRLLPISPNLNRCVDLVPIMRTLPASVCEVGYACFALFDLRLPG